MELPHPPHSPDLTPCEYFLFPRFKSTLLEENIKKRQNLGSTIFWCLNSEPRKDYENAFKIKDYKRLKLCISHDGEYFGGLR